MNMLVIDPMALLATVGVSGFWFALAYVVYGVEVRTGKGPEYDGTAVALLFALLVGVGFVFLLFAAYVWQPVRWG